MRIVLALAALAALTVSAFAQPPKEIVGSDTIELQPGDAKVLRFDQPFSRLDLTLSGIVEIVPESDQVFTLRAIRSGAVQLTAFGADGRVVHRSNVLVGGRIVKIYGADSTRRGRQTRDFDGYLCTSTSCGRANTDVPSALSSVSVSETRANPDGTTTTTTQQYR